MAMAMAVMVVVVMVMVTVMAGRRVPRGVAGRRDASVSLQFLHASSMHVSRVGTGSLQTSVGQQLDNGFEVLHSTLWRSGQSNDQGLVTNPGNRPGHHGD